MTLSKEQLETLDQAIDLIREARAKTRFIRTSLGYDQESTVEGWLTQTKELLSSLMNDVPEENMSRK